MSVVMMHMGGTRDDGQRTTDNGERTPSSVLRPLSSILPMVLGLLLFTATPARSVEVGERWPDFAVQTFDEGHLSRATLEGKPALLVFWNTWCSECRRELPEVDRVAATFAPAGLAVVAINTGLNDSERKARAYWKKGWFHFPVGYDHGFEIAEAFGVRGVPTVFLVDREGIVRYKQARLPEEMTEWVRRLAAGEEGDRAGRKPQ